MMTAEDNKLLTLTGPDAPMGDLFRRYWMPVLPATNNAACAAYFMAGSLTSLANV